MGSSANPPTTPASSASSVSYLVTNEQFLRAVFGARWGEALVAYFPGDPKPPNPLINWSTYPAAQVQSLLRDGKLNWYWDVSLPRPGGSRQGADFGELHAIVIDDYGVKVDRTLVEQLLGRGPNYVLETSPGNYHAGWFCEALGDRAWVLGMLRSLYRALGNTGDNLVKPTTLVRLPVGANGKAALGPGGFKTRLAAWDPDPDHKIKHADWIDIEQRIGQVVPVDMKIDLDTAMPDPGEIESDVILQVLRERGMVRDEGRSMTFGWGFEIDCPWSGDHLDPRTSAGYVPVKQRFKCHHGHCQDRTMGDLRAWADQAIREDSGGLECLASLEFDEIDPKLLQLPGNRVSQQFMGDDPIVDPWDQKVAPPWPGNILPPVVEDTLCEIAERGGLDLAALGASFLTAASGAADKRNFLQPYAGDNWKVPPVLWLMLIADSGQRKTGTLSYSLNLLRRINAERMKRFNLEMAVFHKLTPTQRQQQPAPTVTALLAEDTTVERLQELMADNPRGLLYVRDELASLLGSFGRYAKGGGGAAAAAERAFFLEAYEGGPHTIARMKRTTVIEHCALAILGGIQPHRLAEFKDLADDGFLPRLGYLVARTTTSSLPGATRPDLSAIDGTIDRLLTSGGFDLHRTDPEGEALIRETEQGYARLAQRPDASPGFRAFMHKLHGTHARAALVLHLIDGVFDPLVPAETVERAAAYTDMLYLHAEVFYAGFPSLPDLTALAIASFLLRHPEVTRVTPGQLRRDVAPARSMKSLREIQDVMFLLVFWGWVKPETPFPGNSAWLVRSGLRARFAARHADETQRVEGLKERMNHRGLYRPTKRGL